jgi:flagellar protein FliS
MFGSTARNAASAYGNVALETGVVSASPHKLIVMLFDGALAALAKAANDMKAGNVAAKGKSISQAISIIDNGLRASLDKAAGGNIAEQLDSLYEYMSGRLLTANLNNQPELLEEVRRMLHELKGAWEQIAPQAGEHAAAPAAAAKA